MQVVYSAIKHGTRDTIFHMRFIWPCCRAVPDFEPETPDLELDLFALTIGCHAWCAELLNDSTFMMNEGVDTTLI